MGNKAWTLKLAWPGAQAFNALSDTDWTVDGKAAGKVRSAQGLTFLQVYGAGHMVDSLTAGLLSIRHTHHRTPT